MHLMRVELTHLAPEANALSTELQMHNTFILIHNESVCKHIYFFSYKFLFVPSFWVGSFEVAGLGLQVCTKLRLHFPYPFDRMKLSFFGEIQI